jgi:hypothetical protein
MRAVLRFIDSIDELLGLHLAGLGRDRYFPFRDVDLDLNNPLDLLECLLDRVAALLSNQAPYFEHEHLVLFGANRLPGRPQRQSRRHKHSAGDHALAPFEMDSPRPPGR